MGSLPLEPPSNLPPLPHPCRLSQSSSWSSPSGPSSMWVTLAFFLSYEIPPYQSCSYPPVGTSQLFLAPGLGPVMTTPQSTHTGSIDSFISMSMYLLSSVDLNPVCFCKCFASSIWGFAGGSDGKPSTRKAGDPGSIPGSRGSPGEGNGYSLQCSRLENPMDRGAWWGTVHGVRKGQTRLNDTFTFTLQAR